MRHACDSYRPKAREGGGPTASTRSPNLAYLSQVPDGQAVRRGCQSAQVTYEGLLADRVAGNQPEGRRRTGGRLRRGASVNRSGHDDPAGRDMPRPLRTCCPGPASATRKSVSQGTHPSAALRAPSVGVALGCGVSVLLDPSYQIIEHSRPLDRGASRSPCLRLTAE
jgi:hypothetical protein